MADEERVVEEEDKQLIKLVGEYGVKRWSTIAKFIKGRMGKQCRERWHNHLDPSLNKNPWTEEEESILIKYHQIYGNKWADIAKFLPGRSDNAIKNHWHCKVKKKMQVVSSQLYSPVVLHGTNNSNNNNNHTIEDDRVSKEVTIERHSSSKLFEGYDPNNNHNNKPPVPAYDEAHSASSSYCCYRFMRLLRMSAATFPNTPSIIRKSSRRN
ncbi:hypothetical protein CsatB_003853 [Cannabis sativa]